MQELSAAENHLGYSDAPGDGVKPFELRSLAEGIEQLGRFDARLAQFESELAKRKPEAQK